MTLLNRQIAKLCLFSVIVSPFAAAQDSAEYERNVADISEQIASISENLNANKALLKNERDELLSVEREIASLSKAIDETQVRILNQQAEDQALSEQIQSLTEQQESDKRSLSELLRSRYTNGEANYLKMILNQENPYAVGRLNNYYQYFASAQQQKLQGLATKIAEYESLNQQHATLLAELEKTQQQQLQQQEELDLSKQEREQTVLDLDKKVASTSEKLAQLEQDRERLNNLIEQIAEQAEKLRKLEEQRLAEERRLAEEQKQSTEQTTAVKRVIRPVVAGGFIQQRGNLSYPVEGNIKYRFGSRLPESGMRAEGMFFDTNGATQVNSIFNGRVLFADFLKGYGLLLIIDHGDDHISLYGHNELLYKKVGDPVAANEVVAKSGVSGGLKTHGLYFEIRKNATPVDPSNWFQ